ncbi:hypothetical protein WJX82_000078 [Trebouxia sp. C0006]
MSGYPPQGYPQQQYPAQGVPQQGYVQQQYPPQQNYGPQPMYQQGVAPARTNNDATCLTACLAALCCCCAMDAIF